MDAEYFNDCARVCNVFNDLSPWAPGTEKKDSLKITILGENRRIFGFSCFFEGFWLGLAMFGFGRVRVEKKVGSGQGQKVRSTLGSDPRVIL